MLTLSTGAVLSTAARKHNLISTTSNRAFHETYELNSTVPWIPAALLASCAGAHGVCGLVSVVSVKERRVS